MKEKANWTARTWLHRSLLLLAGLIVLAFGVSFSIKAELGTSPISSLPYVVSCFTPLTVGTATIILHVILITLQILILRKDYDWMQLLQLPVAFIFGYLCDFTLYLVDAIQCTTYFWQWICCIISIVLTAAGVSLEVGADVTTLAGEGFVLAVCRVLPVQFGTMKVIFDVAIVLIAVILSFVFLHGLVGVREGTVAAALLVGTLSRKMKIPGGSASH